MADVEKDYGRNQNNGGLRPEGSTNGHTHLDSEMGSDAALKRIQTAGSISISPELFEKIYLSPQSAVKGDLRKTFANPTPICLVGFLLALTPLCIDLMGWRSSGGLGAANIGPYYWFGGLLMIIGSILEFILGNTFSFVTFGSYGAFWLSNASTLTPAFNVYGAYSPDPTAPYEGLDSPVFFASFGFFLLFMGLLSLIFLICALRTNICFVIIFVTLVAAFGLLAGEYWYLAEGDVATAAHLQTAGGAFLFVTSASGWWILFVQMLAAVDFPFTLPVGDISGLIKGGSERRRAKEQYSV